MYDKLIEQFEYLKKVASEEDFENICSEIIKQAGVDGEVVGDVVKAAKKPFFNKFDKAVGKGVVGLGKTIVKNPGKTIGVGLTAGVLGAGAKKGVGIAKAEVNDGPSPYDANSDNPVDTHNITLPPKSTAFGNTMMKQKTASYDDDGGISPNTKPFNKKNNSSPKFYAYAPEAALAASLALYGLQAHKSGFSQANRDIAMGAQEAGKKILSKKLFTKNPVTRMLVSVVRKGNKITDELKKKIVDDWIADFQDVNHVNRTKASEAYEDLGDDVKAQIFNDYSQAHPNSRFHINMPKDTKALKKWFKKNSPKQEDISKGLGAGAAFGLSNLAIHTLGDKYFVAKDDDEVKARLRRSYGNDISAIDTMSRLALPKREPYRTPQQRIQDIDREIALEKDANWEEMVNEEMKNDKVFKKGAKKLLKEDVLGNMKKGLIYTGVPLAVGTMVNRDIKKDFSKIKDPKNGDAQHNGRVIIEVPLDSKKAEEDARLEKIAINLTKIKSVLKASGKEDLSNAVKSLSWNVPVAVASYATGRNIRGNGEKNSNKDHLGPVPVGKARIIIETNDGSNDAQDSEYSGLSSRASEIIDLMHKHADDGQLKFVNSKKKLI